MQCIASKKGLVAAIAVALGLSAAAFDASAVLAPGRADTYVSAIPHEQASNFGEEKAMKVSPDAFSLVRFNLTNTFSGWVCSEEVDKATLMLWVRAVETPGLIDVHLVTADWKEMDVTWKTRPPAQFLKTVEVKEAGQYLMIDVTDEARAWINDMNWSSGECRQGSASNFGLLLSPNYAQQARVEFDTKMSGGIAPMLDVTLFDHSAGAPGPRGETGPAGPQGERGEAGPQGLRGEPGPQGLRGEAGPQGLRGEAGPQGLRGETGSQGLRGEAGSQGLRGEAGPQGLRGETGPQGLRGEAGTQGLRGEAGPQGLRGEAGTQGLRGEAGPQGLRGEAGPQGVPGEAGSQGLRGETGPQGMRGEAGPQGSRGEAGPQGLRGEAGPAGQPGPVGPQGPAGPGGVGSVTVRTASGPAGVGLVQMDCEPGEFAISGGGMSTNSNKFILKTVPTVNGLVSGGRPNGWLVEMTAAGQDVTTIFVVCVQ